jgi:hypothetical protein
MLLTYAIEAALPGLSWTETIDAFDEALDSIAAVCAIEFERIPDARKANLFFEVRPIDQAGSTLAYQTLPCGPDTPQRQITGRYDTGEPWIVSVSPPPNRIDAVRVIAHETSHGVGLEHGPEGALLAPFYDRSIRTPQEWDIAELQIRYGPPLATPPIPPPTVADIIIDLRTTRIYAKEISREAKP